MANEYRFTSVVGQALTGGDGKAQFTSVVAQALQTAPALATVTAVVGQALVSPFREFTLTSLAVEALVSLRSYMSPSGILAETDDSECFPLSYKKIPNVVIQPTNQERNPFAAHLPNDEDEKRIYLEEQQRILREQHNKTQAGDTTFDFHVLLGWNPNKLYTLGSIGRFYHEAYGLIVARYVQFRKMQKTPMQGAPLGRFKNTSALVDWVVTNDYFSSDASLVLGIGFQADIPPDGSYGWAVIQGANPTRIASTTDRVPEQGEPYTWTAIGGVGLDAPGKPVARKWGKAKDHLLPAGALFIEIEQTSPADFVLAANGLLAGVWTELEKQSIAIYGLEESVADLQALGKTHTKQIATLSQRITAEERTRSQQIQLINDKLAASGDWSIAIADGDNEVRAEFATADAAIASTANTALLKANQALELIVGYNIPEMQVQISSLTAAVNSLAAAGTLLLDPTVEASVGQILVATEGVSEFGFPVIQWTPTDNLLANLADVDFTIPPADGDAMLWDESSGKWKAGQPKTLIPMVDGSIPPVLICGPDGSLVLVEYES